MQILKLTANKNSNLSGMSDKHCSWINYSQAKGSVLKEPAITFKGGIEKELVNSLKNVANNAELKNIFANPQKKKTFMELLVTAIATVTTMLCADDKDEAAISGDIFVKSNENNSSDTAQSGPSVSQTSATGSKDTGKAYKTEEIKKFITENCSKEINILNQVAFIEKNYEAVNRGYQNNEYLKYKDKKDEFAGAVLAKLEKLAEMFLDGKQNDSSVEKFLADLKSDMISDSSLKINSDKIEESLRGVISLIKDAYIDKIVAKFSDEKKEILTRQSVEEVLAQIVSAEDVKNKEVLKEIPKVQGKHTYAEKSMLSSMEQYKGNVPLYNKFVDVYTRFCAKNRNGVTSVDGKQVNNVEVAKQISIELANAKNEDEIATLFDRYSAVEILTKNGEVTANPDEKESNNNASDTSLKKKPASKNTEMKSDIPSKLKRERSKEVCLSSELAVYERMQKLVEILKKEVNITSKDIVNRAVTLPRYKMSDRQKDHFIQTVKTEINSRTKCPYKNLNKISEEQLIDVINSGIFNPEMFTLHSVLRFLDRFVLGDIDLKNADSVKNVAAEKIKVFEEATDASTSGKFRMYMNYQDNSCYVIHVPILPSNLDGQLKEDYIKYFGNKPVILSIDGAGYLHTVFSS